MPELGESVTEGTVTRWLKQVGDTVEVDEPLLEVSTDKVDTEIPSPVAGTLLSITADEDETVQVGAELAVVGDPDQAGGEQSGGDRSSSSNGSGKAPTDDAPAAERDAETPDDQEPVAEQPAPRGSGDGKATAEAEESAERDEEPENQPKRPSGDAGSDEGSADDGDSRSSAPYVTPLVRKLASENDVDLSTVSGSGVGGRIRKQDVLAAAEKAARARRSRRRSRPPRRPQRRPTPRPAVRRPPRRRAPPSRAARSRCRGCVR